MRNAERRPCESEWVSVCVWFSVLYSYQFRLFWARERERLWDALNAFMHMVNFPTCWCFVVVVFFRWFFCFIVHGMNAMCNVIDVRYYRFICVCLSVCRFVCRVCLCVYDWFSLHTKYLLVHLNRREEEIEAQKILIIGQNRRYLFMFDICIHNWFLCTFVKVFFVPIKLVVASCVCTHWVHRSRSIAHFNESGGYLLIYFFCWNHSII